MIKYDVTVEEFSGDVTRTIWKVDGERHRLDGPAVEWSDGDKSYWVEGIKLSEEEFYIRNDTPFSASKLLCKLNKIVVFLKKKINK